MDFDSHEYAERLREARLDAGVTEDGMDLAIRWDPRKHLRSILGRFRDMPDAVESHHVSGGPVSIPIEHVQHPDRPAPKVTVPSADIHSELERPPAHDLPVDELADSGAEIGFMMRRTGGEVTGYEDSGGNLHDASLSDYQDDLPITVTRWAAPSGHFRSGYDTDRREWFVERLSDKGLERSVGTWQDDAIANWLQTYEPDLYDYGQEDRPERALALETPEVVHHLGERPTEQEVLDQLLLYTDVGQGVTLGVDEQDTMIVKTDGNSFAIWHWMTPADVDEEDGPVQTGWHAYEIGLTIDGVIRELNDIDQLGLHLARPGSPTGARNYEPIYSVPGVRPGSGTHRFRKQRRQERKSSSSSGFDEKAHPRGGKGTKEGGQFIRKGSTGTAVSNIQSALGINDPSGRYGAKTKRMIKEYQEANGLLVDGIVGAETASSLLGRENVKEPGALTQSLYHALESSGELARRRSRSLTDRNTRRSKRKARNRDRSYP